MKYQILIIGLLAIASLGANAQGNLVVNGDFELLEKKVKGQGGIDVTEGWSSIGDANADIFHPKAKDDNYKVPLNLYGDAQPMSGETYAGIVIYSAKDAEPRTYLQNQLRSALEEGKVYCVKMNIMLGILSKYSSNNIGIYLSEKPLSMEEIESGEIQPQIIHSQNQIWDEQFDWSAICGTFIAQGKERYVTIGNFGQTSKTLNEKMKRPRGFTGQQTRTTAYYYVEDVSVINMAGLSDCDCEKAPDGTSMQVRYSSNVSTETELDISESIELTKVYFEDLSSTISSRAMVDVEKVAEMMKTKPELKIQIKGHTDPVEQAKSSGDVSLLRAQTIKEKLVELGVNGNKLQVLGMKDFDPATDDSSVTGQAQNRRVVFDILD